MTNNGKNRKRPDSYTKIIAKSQPLHPLSMNSQSFIDQLDQVIYQYTGQHLDTLQVAILKGVLDDRKYADIAEN